MSAVGGDIANDPTSSTKCRKSPKTKIKNTIIVGYKYNKVCFNTYPVL